jgi:hypothetical protein
MTSLHVAVAAALYGFDVTYNSNPDSRRYRIVYSEDSVRYADNANEAVKAMCALQAMAIGREQGASASEIEDLSKSLVEGIDGMTLKDDRVTAA